MSGQNISGGPNPFASAGAWLATQYNRGLRQQHAQHQAAVLQDALTIHAVTHENALKQSRQEARLTEKAETGKSQRATEFLQTVHGMAEPGTPVKISHGNISAGFTKAVPKPPTPKAVPVKKSRGGKRKKRP